MAMFSLSLSLSLAVARACVCVRACTCVLARVVCVCVCVRVRVRVCVCQQLSSVSVRTCPQTRQQTSSYTADMLYSLLTCFTAALHMYACARAWLELF